MNSETRLTELLRDTADAHTPPDGLERIHERAAGRRIRAVGITAAVGPVTVPAATFAMPIRRRAATASTRFCRPTAAWR